MQYGPIHPCSECGAEVQTLISRLRHWPHTIEVQTGTYHICPRLQTEEHLIVGCPHCDRPVIAFGQEYRTFTLGWRVAEMPVHVCPRPQPTPQPVPLAKLDTAKPAARRNYDAI